MANESKNMTVKDLKNILADLPDDMDVIIPIILKTDCNFIDCFRRVRTAGILKNVYEEHLALCLNTAEESFDISRQVRSSGLEATTCEKVLFGKMDNKGWENNE